MLLGTILVLCLTGFAAGQQRCYGDDLGCYPYVVPLMRPESVERMQVSFRLYKTPTTDYEIITKDNVLSTQFDPALGTVVIAHGYGLSTPIQYNQPMKDEILKLETAYNVIMVDAKIALRLGLRAFSNALVVGGLIEQLLRALRDNAGAQFSDFHLIGQSLGAHVVGYAGKRARENGDLIGRITGLDPSNAFYEDKSFRLGATDADFVDCVRLDIGGYGIGGRCGTVDYYVNGGMRQPGCSERDDIFSSCSHEGFLFMFVESINSTCSFIGHPCTSMEDFDSGACSDCLPGGCAVLGFSPDGQMGRFGSFYLRTNAQYPFCIEESR